ncbi:MAG: hypothetical protein ACI9Y7_000938 [Dokdonia sp.]|jgi:hypothetical protein
MKKIIGILLIGIIICSCSSDDDTSNTSSNIVGTWNWARTFGGFGGVTTTPASSGNVIRLEITNTTIKRYMNDDLISESDYTIEMSQTTSGESLEIIISNGGNRTMIDLEGAILSLTGEADDSSTSEYLRDE